MLVFVAALAAAMLFAGPASAGIEWRILDGIQLDDTPVDITISNDGASVYVLCRESIKVYSMPDRNLVESIPLKGPYSQLTLGPDNETLFLTDTAGKKISIVEVTPVFDIKIGHSQVLGKADAPVNVVIFSDYQ